MVFSIFFLKNDMRSRTKEERRSRAAAAFKVSEDIAMEREGIVKQLDLLRAVNSKMLDERDAQNAMEEADSKGRRERGIAEELEEAGGGGGLRDGVEGRDDSESEVEEVDLSKILASRNKPSYSEQRSKSPSAAAATSATTNGASGSNATAMLLLPPSVGGGGVSGASECEYDDEFFDVNSAKSPVMTERSFKSSSSAVVAPTPAARRLQSHGSRDSATVSLHDELAAEVPSFDGEEDEDEVGGLMGSSASGSNHSRSSRRRRTNSFRRRQQNMRKHGSAALPPRATNTTIIVQGQQQHIPHGGSEADWDEYDDDEYDLSPSTNTSCTGPVSYGDSDLASFSAVAARNSNNYYIRPLSSAITHEKLSTSEPQPMLPERVFKLIFIGDSCVGKTSLITRFCRGQYNPDVKSTVGVDFHTRSVVVEGTGGEGEGDEGGSPSSVVCLQCWDTAGQERYRSITKQYFRKADAVIVVYDVTSENRWRDKNLPLVF